MTVQELMDILANYAPETLVILSSDAEGNNYSPLDDIGEDETEFNAVIFYPVN